jgi:hypothetical protein
MRDRRMHIDDKKKMYESWKGMLPAFSNEVLLLFKAGEEISAKELSERSKKINAGYSFYNNAINRVLTNE